MPWIVCVIGTFFLCLGLKLELLSATWLLAGCLGIGIVVIGMLERSKKAPSEVSLREYVGEQHAVDFEKFMDEASDEFRNLDTKSE